MYKLKILLSKKYPSDGGTIFIEKIASHLNTQVIGLNEISPVTNLYIRFLDAKIGKFISRLPFYEVTVGTLLIQLIFLLDIRRIKGAIGCDDILLPSDKFFLFRLCQKFIGNKIHFICLDLPWSYPNSKINNSFIRNYTKRSLMKFSTIGVCTSEMAVALEVPSQIRTYVNYSSFDLYNTQINKLPQRKSVILSDHPLKIVFAGNMRFRSAIYDMLNQLDYQKIDYEFDVFSSTKFEDPRVNNMGFKTSSELGGILSGYDFGLVPMSFDSRDNEIVSTSFPSKTFFYLSAGLPVLVHAPEHASVSNVCKTYGFGTTVTELGSFTELSFDLHTFKLFVDRQWSTYFNVLGI